jgi:AraC family transcriptional activator of pobA
MLFSQRARRSAGDMRTYRPILLKDLDIRVPGVDVIRVCLNRHLPETDWVRRHQHEFAQFLLYLTGKGRQQIGGNDFEVNAGTLFLVPAGLEHSFHKERVRAPLCLVVDLRLRDEPSLSRVARHLTSGQLTRVRHLLSQLASLGQNGAEVRASAVILSLVDQLLSASREEAPRTVSTPVARRVMKILQGADLASLCPAEIAAQSGYQRDHLNRILKREVGQTTGQLLSEARLLRAKYLLERGLKVSDVGETVGVLDQNYFARWFKQQTGRVPSAWRSEAFQRQGDSVRGQAIGRDK